MNQAQNMIESLDNISTDELVGYIVDFKRFTEEHEGIRRIDLKKYGFGDYVDVFSGDSFQERYKKAKNTAEQICSLLNEYGSPENVPRSAYSEALDEIETERGYEGESAVTLGEKISEEKRQALVNGKIEILGKAFESAKEEDYRETEDESEESGDNYGKEEVSLEDDSKISLEEEAVEYFRENPEAGKEDLESKGYLEVLQENYGDHLINIADELGVEEERREKVGNLDRRYSDEKIEEIRRKGLEVCARHKLVGIEDLAGELGVSTSLLYNRVFEGGIQDFREKAREFALQEFEKEVKEDGDPEEILESFEYKSALDKEIRENYTGSLDNLLEGLGIEKEEDIPKGELRDGIKSVLREGPKSVKEVYTILSESMEDLPFARVMSNMNWMDSTEKTEDGVYKLKGETEQEEIKEEEKGRKQAEEEKDGFEFLLEGLEQIDHKAKEEDPDKYKDRIMSETQEALETAELDEGDQKLVERGIKSALNVSLEEIIEEAQQEVRQDYEERIDLLKDRFI